MERCLYTYKGQMGLADGLIQGTLVSSTYGLEASGALSKNRKQPKPKKIPSEAKVSSPKLTEGSKQSQLVSLGTEPDPQDLERNIQLDITILPSTLDEGTRKSQPLPKGTTTDPKDSGGNDHLADRDLIFTASDEGAAKTTSFLEGPRGDKDLEGLKPPADIGDPSGTNANHQADQTQSARVRYRSLNENKGKTSVEVKPDIKALQLKTFVDVQPLLLSDDEMVQESDEEEVFAAGENIDEDT
ncbi:hypothetical protein Tco_0404860 [Tanacetum coccineum]